MFLQSLNRTAKTHCTPTHCVATALTCAEQSKLLSSMPWAAADSQYAALSASVAVTQLQDVLSSWPCLLQLQNGLSAVWQ